MLAWLCGLQVGAALEFCACHPPAGSLAQHAVALAWPPRPPPCPPPLQSGADSPMLQWEQRHLADNGVLSNPELFDVVEAISFFKGSSFGQEAGGRG